MDERGKIKVDLGCNVEGARATILVEIVLSDPTFTILISTSFLILCNTSDFANKYNDLIPISLSRF